VSWQASLAAFAVVRLLTVLPITPGGLGITELGLVGILTAGSGHRVGAQVIAAVLLFRALTFLLPVPLGAAACLAWRHAPALLHLRPRQVPGDDRHLPLSGGLEGVEAASGEPADEAVIDAGKPGAGELVAQVVAAGPGLAGADGPADGLG
jgi:hypothetical protein